jgi:GTPase
MSKASLAASSPTAHQGVLDRILRGERRTVARAISEVENETAAGYEIMRAIHPHLGRARVVGITGSPGAGKSTLVSALIGEFAGRGCSIGVIAVDPSSPFSGGALLGDRVRMERHALSERVFIRSLATRGHLGGLSRAVFRVVDVLDAAGFDMIIIETVGAGQSEVEIADIADARVVVCAPGLGDDVQAIKAGILEIADLLVVSKCDLPLADKTELDLRFMVSLRKNPVAGPEVLRVTAATGEGVPQLADAIDAFLASKKGRRVRGSAERVRRHVANEAANTIRERLAALRNEALDELLAAFARGEIRHEEVVEQALRLAIGKKG